MNLDFHKIVSKLSKKRWKLVKREDIFDYIDPDKMEKNASKLDKLVYLLLSKKVLITLKKWIYVIPTDVDLKTNEIDLLERYYFPLIKKIISQNVRSDYFICWKNSLDFNMKNFAVPDKLFVMTRSLNKKIKIWDKELIFKTISWNVKWKKTNIFSRLNKFVNSFEVSGFNFRVANLELSILESGLISDNKTWNDIELLMKTLLKYKKVLNFKTFEEIWEFKYILSINRLKELSKSVDNQLYKCFLDIVKKKWLFVWNSIRKI